MSWTRAFRDLPREHAFEPLRVEGTLPQGLEGTFYKNGPGRFSRHGRAYGHWFDGDGAVTAVRLAGGKAWGAVRLVQTPGLEREARAVRPLFGGYNTPAERPLREIFLQDRKNPSNTSVMLWQGRLFALCEAGLPVEIDRDALSAAGERDLGGVITAAFSAHPHHVPARRAFYNVGIANGPRARLSAYELPHAGRPRRIAEVEIAGPTLVHDFAATDRHLVVSVAPMRMRLLPFLLRRAGAVDAMEWRSDEGTELVVIPIDDPASTFRLRVDAHLCEHVANAFERDGTLCFDFTRYPDMRALEDHVGSLASGEVRAPLGSSICRATLDLRTRKARFEERLAAPCELPRVSPRVDAAPHRFVYLAGYASDADAARSFFNAVLKLDVERGTVDRFLLPPGTFTGEALFTPRPGGSAEDDGHLLTLTYDAATDRSALTLLDARAPTAPLVAQAWFDHLIPPGFHGVWSS